MNINSWRSGLKRWLDRHLLVSSWDVRNPTEYGSLSAFLPPLQAVEYLPDEVGTCTAIQDIYLTWRYRGDTLYIELPLGDLEQLHATISRRLTLTWADIAPLVDLTVLAVSDSVKVEEYGDRKEADWLIGLSFSLRLTWQIEVTPLPGDTTTPTPEVVRIESGLYTEQLGSTDHRDPATRDRFGRLAVDRTV